MITNQSVTIYHYDDTEQKYRRYYFENANVHYDRSIRIDKGTTAVAELKIRIPTEEDIKVFTGDKLIIGCCPSLKPPKGNESHIVTHVIDNRRGSRNMRHWRLICE